MVLVIAVSPEGDVLERWTFDVHTDAAVKGGGAAPDKDEAEIVAEIQAIIRQVRREREERERESVERREGERWGGGWTEPF